MARKPALPFRNIPEFRDNNADPESSGKICRGKSRAEGKIEVPNWNGNRRGIVASFDWHGDKITRDTPITTSYKNTQNVRRFFKSECGDGFKFDRSFMAWLKGASGLTMAEAVEEWRRRQALR